MIGSYARRNRWSIPVLLWTSLAIPHVAIYAETGREGQDALQERRGLAATGTPERYYVLRNGRKVLLDRSNSEIAVIFRPVANIKAARKQLEKHLAGTLEDVPGAPHARVKIFRSNAKDGPDRDLLRGHPEVEDVRPLYRFRGSQSPVVSTGRIVAKTQKGMTAEQRQRLWREHGVLELEAIHRLHDVYELLPRDPTADDVLLAEALAGDDRVLWANPDLLRRAKPLQVDVGDEYFDLQWHLHNEGQTEGTPDADIDAPEAWALSTGAGVLFGMFDDSCDVDHEDLEENYIGIGQDITLPFFAEGYDDPRPKNPNDAHGTAVMGLAVAAANNLGVRGVAYRAQFTASRGLNNFITDAALAGAFTFALDQNVDVHINSWGEYGSFATPPVIEEAIVTAMTEGRDLDGEGGKDPLGMVIVFSSGNENVEKIEGLSISAIPGVISVGASTGQDTRASFSNFGESLNFLAPGGDSVNIGITTTDTTDDNPNFNARGYNLGGVAIFPGFPTFSLGPDIDPGGKYTGQFGGTSAACPIAAGIAGLILSINENLTADDVRIIMEHSTDKIDATEANYDPLTSKSFKYGYGRVNAFQAVQAARDSLTNGGFTWPDVAKTVVVGRDELQWKAGIGTTSFLVLESAHDFAFAPEDNACYDGDQPGCGGRALTLLPTGVDVLFVGCAGNCEKGTQQHIAFERPAAGTKLFGIYGHSTSGRYSFGVAAQAQAIPPPSVSITVSALEGNSPLTVQFNGNAVSEAEIDNSRTVWDFDADVERDDDTANSASASFTYSVPPGETRIFTARLTMYDINGNAGSAQVRIRVIGDQLADVSVETTDVRIIVGLPGTSGSDISSGVSPLAVELRIDATTPANVQSVVWDLGDGNRASGLIVPHTFRNDDASARTYVVVATVTTKSTGGAIVAQATNRQITVLPGSSGGPDVDNPNLPGTGTHGGGGSASPCGALGLIPLIMTPLSLLWWRRRGYASL